MTHPTPHLTGDDATRRSYDTVAERYAAEISNELDGKPLDRALLNAFIELTAGGPLADIGCGPGHATAHLSERGAAPVLGVDLSPAMCTIAHRTTGLSFAAADMTALPFRSESLAGLLCWYALIHLDAPHRTTAYTEFARVLRPGAHALLAFHTSDPDTSPGESLHLTTWWTHPVDLTFRFLDPDAVTEALAGAGLALTARLDREPHAGSEHASKRSYLLVRKHP